MGIETCEFLVGMVLAFGMENIKNLKVKERRVLTGVTEAGTKYL